LVRRWAGAGRHAPGRSSAGTSSHESDKSYEPHQTNDSDDPHQESYKFGGAYQFGGPYDHNEPSDHNERSERSGVTTALQTDRFL
jgi:hypothetical protein